MLKEFFKEGTSFNIFTGDFTESAGCDLESKIEKNVYFLGEIINVNGPCGGYNLTFAFACANKLKNLK